MAKTKENKKEESKEEDKKKSSDKKEVSKPTSDTVLLNGDITLFVKEPLPYLDKGEVKAYRARDNAQHNGNLFVLVCSKAMTPRFLSISKYSSINSTNLCKLVSHGKVYWPLTKQEAYCFVYEDSMGMPLLNNHEGDLAFGWKAETVMTNIIVPMIETLTKLRNKEVHHGEIWLGNLFDGGVADGQKIFVGECLAVPSGSQMPALYESMERALADSIGRGVGDSIDDLYSFGVCLTIMLRTEDPMKGLSDREIVEQKLEKGSYLALMGKERLSGALLELLRGLLFDHPEQRWTVEDLEAWVDGRRLSPKQAPKRAKSMRPLVYNGQNYTRPEVLAMDLHQDSNETVRITENEDLVQWVERAVEEKMTKSRLEQAINYLPALERGSNYNDRVAVVISHALYPEAAIRYKDVAFQPSGFGKYLTQRYVEEKDIQPFADILKYSFIIPIIREARISDKGTLMAAFDLCRSYIKQKVLNGGAERCIYIMDPEAPCLSPIVKEYYIQSTADMMFAFEDLCAKTKPDILFDRHVVGFLSVKDRQNIDPYVMDLMSQQRHERVLAQLKMLATMQKRCDLKGLPSLAKWISGELKPVYERLHDKTKREAVEKKIEVLAKEGSIQSIAAALNNDNLYQNDLGHLKTAMKQYDALVKEQNLIKENLKKGRHYGQDTGQQLASVFSMLLAIIIMIISVYQVFSGG